MSEELAYSIHLGSDKNKTAKAKEVAKNNPSGETSFSNNGIQNAKDLSDVNKHNLRDYDNERELIRTIYGTDDIVNDVKQVYLDEFEQARLEYNNKQTRNDRKIDNYFTKVCESQNDIACEIVIELGDMDFWNDKDQPYRLKMIDVYNEQLAKKEQKLEKANTQTKQLDNTSKDIDKILNNLKHTLMNKNNMGNVKDITQTVRSVNDLNMVIKDFEHSAFEIEKENCSLKYEIELKDNEIGNLKKELSTKDKIISKLQTEKEKLKQELQKFKGFWHSIMSHFHKRICYDKDNNYKIVSDDLYKNGIFDNDDNEIANNIARRVTIPDENKEKKKNNDTRF